MDLTGLMDYALGKKKLQPKAIGGSGASKKNVAVGGIEDIIAPLPLPIRPIKPIPPKIIGSEPPFDNPFPV